MKHLQNEISSFITEAATMVKYNRSCFGQTALAGRGGTAVARSLKSTTTQPAVGGPKTFWEDQRAWRPKNLAAHRDERTKVLRRQTTGGTLNIYQTDRGQKITHLCRWLNLSKFTRFLGGPN